MLKKSIFTLMAGLLTIASLQADIPQSDFSLFTGYKQAHLKTSLSASDPADADPFGYFPSEIKRARIWQIGIAGRYAFPDFLGNCGCETAWLKSFYLRGYAAWGRVYSGKFKDSSITVGGNSAENNTSIKNGYSRTYDIALGWLYPWCDTFGIGPVIGYNYDKLKTKQGSFDNNPGADHVRYISRFKGGYVGVDLVYNLCDWKLFAGYEYHWPKWSGGYRLPGYDNDDAYSDKRSAKQGHGNVFYVDGRYVFCNCWELGLLFRYENYRSGSGSAVPLCCEDCSEIPSSEYDKIRTKYHAWSINLELASSF